MQWWMRWCSGTIFCYAGDYKIGCVNENVDFSNNVNCLYFFTREAKKDQVGRQAYRILTSIHDSFEQIAENLLATDRARREVADYEGKLATMASRTVDIDKLKADLDTIRRENDLLEARLSENLSKDSSQSVG